METLIVYRDWNSAYCQSTTLKTEKGSIKAIITSSNKQPKYGSKTIEIRNKTYSLDWSKVILIKGKTIKTN